MSVIRKLILFVATVGDSTLASGSSKMFKLIKKTYANSKKKKQWRKSGHTLDGLEEKQWQFARHLEEAKQNNDLMDQLIAEQNQKKQEHHSAQRKSKTKHHKKRHQRNPKQQKVESSRSTTTDGFYDQHASSVQLCDPKTCPMLKGCSNLKALECVQVAHCLQKQNELKGYATQFNKEIKRLKREQCDEESIQFYAGQLQLCEEKFRTYGLAIQRHLDAVEDSREPVNYAPSRDYSHC